MAERTCNQNIRLDLYELDQLREATRGGMHRGSKKLKMEAYMVHLKCEHDWKVPYDMDMQHVIEALAQDNGLKITS